MKFKCLVSFGLIVAVHSASIYSNPIDIPVKVIYGEEEYEVQPSKLPGDAVGRGNLDEKVQVSVADLRQISKIKEEEYHGNPNSLRNLDAKTQLSQEDLLQANKHLPLDQGELGVKGNSVEETPNAEKPVEKPAENAGVDVVKPDDKESPQENLQPIGSSTPGEATFGLLGESTSEKQPSTAMPISSEPTTEENLPDPNYILLIQIAQNIVSSGLTSIRENIDNLSGSGDSNKNPPITASQWHTLNQTISDFFSTLLQGGYLKSSNKEYVLRDIVAGVRDATNNFVQDLRQANASQTTEPQRPGIGQNILNLISAGFNRITSSISNIPTQSTTKTATVLGDAAESTAAPTPTTTSSGPIQNIINQVQQFFGVATAAPGSQGDEGSTPTPLQNVANQVGQVINNLNPFKPTTAAPDAGTAGDDPTTAAPNPNPFQPFQNAVGQVINNFIRPTQGPTAAPGAQGDEQTTAASPFQNVINQFGQVVNNINPFAPTSTAAPGAQNEETSTAGPFQQAFQNVASQVGAVINNFIPGNNPSSTAAPEAQNEGVGTSTNPLQSIQNAVGEAGQNVINQISQAANNLNPANQGSSSTSAPISGSLQTIQSIGSQGQQLLAEQPPANLVQPVVETIQSIGSEITPTKNQAAVKVHTEPSEEEIMVALD